MVQWKDTSEIVKRGDGPAPTTRVVTTLEVQRLIVIMNTPKLKYVASAVKALILQLGQTPVLCQALSVILQLGQTPVLCQALSVRL